MCYLYETGSKGCLTEIDQDGQRLGFAARVDVEVETVFVARTRVEAIHGRRAKGARLRAQGGLLCSWKNTRALCRLRRLRRLPSQLADGRRGVADAVRKREQEQTRSGNSNGQQSRCQYGK